MNGVVEFVHGVRFDGLGGDIKHAAHRSLLDTLGVALSGTQTETAGIIANHAMQHYAAASDGPGANLWLNGAVVSPAGAALANGMTIDAIDAHDGFKPVKGHIGCGVIPALFAMAQATGNDDPHAFMDALVMGYEIGARAGFSLHNSVSDYHTSGAWVALAAAAIGARYLGLDASATREALGIAEFHGPRSQMMRVIDAPTMLKDGSGWGAMAGISAAYLARDGFTGAPAVTIENDECASHWQCLNERWTICEQYIKLYPVCRWAQPPVEAALALQREHRFTHDEISAIRVTTFHEAARLATKHPTTSAQAQYSLPFSVAAALVHGTIEPAHVLEDAIDAPGMRRLQDILSMQEDEFCNREFPARRWAAVAIDLDDGRQLHSPMMEAQGDPENPVSDDVLSEKFAAYATPVIGMDRAMRLHDAVFNVPENGLNTVFELMTARPQVFSRGL